MNTPTFCVLDKKRRELKVLYLPSLDELDSSFKGTLIQIDSFQTVENSDIWIQGHELDEECYLEQITDPRILDTILPGFIQERRSLFN